MKSLTFLKKINAINLRIAKVFLILCIALQLIIVFMGVVFRYVFSDPLSWTEELSTYLMIYITFFGCYVAIDGDQLARIDIFMTKFKPKAKYSLIVVGHVITLLFLIMFMYYGTTLYFSFTVQKQISIAMRLPMRIYYISIPLATAMMIIRMIIRIIDIREEEEKKTGRNVEWV